MKCPDCGSTSICDHCLRKEIEASLVYAQRLRSEGLPETVVQRILEADSRLTPPFTDEAD